MDLIGLNKIQDEILNLSLEMENYYYKEQDVSKLKIIHQKIDKIKKFIDDKKEKDKKRLILEQNDLEKKKKLITEIEILKRNYKKKSEKINLIQKNLLDLEENINIIKKI